MYDYRRRQAQVRFPGISAKNADLLGYYRPNQTDSNPVGGTWNDNTKSASQPHKYHGVPPKAKNGGRIRATRTPKRHVALDGTESCKVRFKVEGRDSSITFYEPGAATEFCIILDSYRGEPQRAIDWLNKREADLAAGITSMTMDEWAADYIATRTRVTEGTRYGYQRQYALTFGRHLGHLQLTQISRRDVAAAVNALVTTGGRAGKGYSDKTMRNAFGLLRSMLSMAVHDDLIPANPCDTVELPERTGHRRTRMMMLSPAEYQRLLEHMPAHYRPLVATLAGTGIRWGEAEALEVADVALDSQLLYVNKAAKWDTTKSVRDIGPTKTLHGDRTVTLPSSLIEVLRPLVDDRKRTERLFIAPKGGPLSHNNFWTYAWVPACEAAGLDPRPRIHDLRHTHAS